jgi:hypothetical protein
MKPNKVSYRRVRYNAPLEILNITVRLDAPYCYVSVYKDLTLKL